MGRLVVVSNRTPKPGKVAAGGLAAALEGVLKRTGGLWVGWSGEFDGRMGVREPIDVNGVKVVGIDVSQDDYEAYYAGYSNSVLWPAFHLRPDLARYDAQFYEGYKRVNEQFADGLAKPDVVAPGKSVHSLRSPGSEADLRYPNFVDGTYRLGSGTSFAAPEVAGAAALLRQADPTATNDRIKFALMETANQVGSANAGGQGTIDIQAALDAPAGEGVRDLGRLPGMARMPALAREDLLDRPCEPRGMQVHMHVDRAHRAIL